MLWYLFRCLRASRVHFTRLLPGVVFIFAFVSCHKPTERPNIIFFIADDMYPEMFNCLPQGKGQNLTPNLDRLAKEGVIMVNQYVTSPVCTPSRYSCLTGRYASRATNQAFLQNTKKYEGQTVIQWNTQITPDEQTLPHYLKKAGYATAMVGKNHVVETSGLHRFPNYQADPREPETRSKVEENYAKATAAVRAAGFDFAGSIYHNNPNFVGLQELAVHNLDWIAEAGVEFMDQQQKNPFFLYFATTVPHGPTEALRSWNADPSITAKGILEEAPDVLPARSTISERLAAAGLAGQKKENVLWLDDALGALLAKLESLDILDNTIIFFFNDHGQHAKGTLYQGGALSPSIIWKKGGFPGSHTRTEMVANIDFAPTILDLAGIEYAPESFDGHSFANVLFNSRGEGEARTSLFFELGFARAVIKGKYKYYTVRYPDYVGDWDADKRSEVLNAYNERRRFQNRYIVNTDPNKPFSHLTLIPGGMEAENESYGTRPGYFAPDQLYDLEADPGETKNLAEDSAYLQLLEELQEEMKEYLADLPGKFEL